MALSRNWIFTDNNPEHDEPDWPDCVKYAIWQKERGENGTEHLQGYVEFKSSKKLTAVKAILPRAHWEIRRGTQQQAMDYASKEDTRIGGPWTFGILTVNAQGTRNDLLALKQALDEGTSMKQIAQDHFVTMKGAHKWAYLYRSLMMPERDWITRVYILIGPSGCGKTTFCKRNCPNAYWKLQHSGNNEWWDGYDGQRDVVLDEFYGWIKWNTLLRLIDASPLRVEIKGGSTQFLARRLFITSNRDIDAWYPNIVDKSALERRIREFGVVITDFNQDIIDN
ncbi:Rep [Molossus molossus associated circovirus 3]|nr:Rep [Molossus molossus associated circovirus 3]